MTATRTVASRLPHRMISRVRPRPMGDDVADVMASEAMRTQLIGDFKGDNSGPQTNAPNITDLLPTLPTLPDMANSTVSVAQLQHDFKHNPWGYQGSAFAPFSPEAHGDVIHTGAVTPQGAVTVEPAGGSAQGFAARAGTGTAGAIAAGGQGTDASPLSQLLAMLGQPVLAGYPLTWGWLLMLAAAGVVVWKVTRD